jgi:hypothetical protein
MSIMFFVKYPDGLCGLILPQSSTKETQGGTKHVFKEILA